MACSNRAEWDTTALGKQVVISLCNYGITTIRSLQSK